MSNNSVERPLVSVITPNFNGERFLLRAIESVQQQNFSVEHIIVDDCSNDGSWSLLEELKKERPWLKCIRLDRNSGPVVARNKAIEVAQGRFLAFLDVDDFWLSNKLKVQVEFMLSRDCLLSFSDYRFVSEDGLKVGRCLRGFNKIGWHRHHMTRYLGCLTIILDRSKYDQFMFPDISSSVRAEDFLAWSSCIRKYGPALRCPHDLARYAVVENSRSSSGRDASVSVWKSYRDFEKISLPMTFLYFLSYVFHVLWKRFWYRPIYNRVCVDVNYCWSVLSDSMKSKVSS